MILVDTSVWVEHFRGTDRAAGLVELLEADEVLLHPWVLGELALGSLGPRRDAVISDLKRLPTAPRVPDDEVLVLIQDRGIAGRGISWVDAQLLASALVGRSSLWTFDTALAAEADLLHL